jgi:hypothetical protein
MSPNTAIFMNFLPDGFSLFLLSIFRVFVPVCLLTLAEIPWRRIFGKE